MMNRSMWATVAVLLAVAVVAMATDEDPLQDVCVADMNAGVTINGFPCKPFAQVSAKDFTFYDLKNPGDTNNANNANVEVTFQRDERLCTKE